MSTRVSATLARVSANGFAKRLLLVGHLCILLGLGGCQESNSRPAIVIGGSMEPTVAGEHLAITCPDCGIHYRFDIARDIPTQRSVVCPNCGDARMKRSDARFGSADRFRVNPERAPKRWDLVAFRMPDGKSAGIKRVVGLPGEALEIRQGNLFSGQEILRKPVSIQKQLRILINDSDYTPKTNLQNRWRPAEQGSRWISNAGMLQFRDAGSPELQVDQLDWLVYHHWRCFSHHGERDEDFPVEDSYGFNQSLSRNLNQTHELFLEMNVTADKDAKFGWRFTVEQMNFEFVIDVENREMAVFEFRDADSQPNRTVVSLDALAHRILTIEFSSIDQQLIAIINGQSVYKRSLESNADVAKYPLAIGAAGGNVDVQRLQIWRDVYYFPVSGLSQELRGQSGFLLLGDNVPISVDSRHWGAIDTDDVLGVVE